MGRSASAETQLRAMKSKCNELQKLVDSVVKQRDTLNRLLEASHNEMEEWKSRFDKLLERTPKE